MAKQNKVKCPDCGEIIELDFYGEIGDIVTCQNCDVELEITETDPPKVKVHKGLDDKEEEQETEDQWEDFGKEDQSGWNE